MRLYFAGTSGREASPRPGAPHGAYEIIWAFSDQSPAYNSIVQVAPTLRRVLIRIPKGASIEQTIRGLQDLIERLYEVKDAKDTDPNIVLVTRN